MANGLGERPVRVSGLGPQVSSLEPPASNVELQASSLKLEPRAWSLSLGAKRDQRGGSGGSCGMTLDFTTDLATTLAFKCHLYPPAPLEGATRLWETRSMLLVAGHW